MIANPALRRPRTLPRLHGPLMIMVVAMATLALISLCGMAIDDRTMLGESVWLKPLKFGFAFAVYGTTLAWLLMLPHRGNRWTWWSGTVFAVAAFVDVVVIGVQAARGTFSHFNTATDPINAIGQQVFVSAGPSLIVASLVLAAIISWQQVADRPTSRAIHAGLGLAVVGMSFGNVMAFTGKELVRDANGKIVELVGKHTVGADDGTGGMPITHWSTVGGDLRIPHFLGLHAIQVLLLAALMLSRLGRRHAWLRDERTRALLVGILAAGYAGLVALTAWQALRAQPLIHPDSATWLALVAIIIAVTLGTGFVHARANRGLRTPSE